MGRTPPARLRRLDRGVLCEDRSCERDLRAQGSTRWAVLSDRLLPALRETLNDGGYEVIYDGPGAGIAQLLGPAGP